MKNSGPLLILLIVGGGVAYYLYTQSQVQSPTTAAINAVTAAGNALIPVNQGGTGPAVAPPTPTILPAPTLPTAPDSMSGLGSYNWEAFCV
jgi:hypothetical protein